MKYTEAKKRQAHHVCVFGEPKTGKSTLTSKLALAGYKLIWISIDNGHTVIDKLPIDAQERIDLYVLPDTQEYPIASETVTKMFTGAEFKFCDLHGKDGCSVCKKNDLSFSTVNFNALGLDTIVVLDNGTQFSRSVGFKIGIGDDKELSGDESWARWRKSNWLVDKLMTNIQQARYNVVMLAHTCEGKTEDGQKKLYPFMSSANYSTTVGGFFDHVVYCEVFNQKHAFGSGSKYKASVMSGSRTDVLLEKMEEPSLVPFFKSLEEIKRTQVEASGVVEVLEAAREQLVLAKPVDLGHAHSSSIASELLARMKK